jgi:4-hydroxy-2-oxoheptanedioate aldolase
MPIAPNRFKRALAKGEKQIGVWSGLGSPLVAEILAHAGFDWIVIDTEHAPSEPRDVLAQLQAMTGGTATPVTRAPWNDMVMLKRILDVGSTSVLIPFVQNAEEARRAVAATRYPPRGVRGVATSMRASGYGRVTDYLQHAHEETCVLVQVETISAVGEIEKIAAVEGVDGIFIGPADLAGSMGHLGNPGHPEVQAAIASAMKRCRAAGKPAGYLSPTEADGEEKLAAGFTFVAVMSDAAILRKGAEALVRRFKG